ncbi:MAG: hypothetical protein AAGF92_02160 [Myxococcota bacterium]
MECAPPDPTDLIDAYNAWNRNDIDVTPAAVAACDAKALPDNVPELLAILPEPHRGFFADAIGSSYDRVRLSAVKESAEFDPSADFIAELRESEAGQRVAAEARGYFGDRSIAYVFVDGTDKRWDLAITLQVALDAEAGRLFSFVQQLSD